MGYSSVLTSRTPPTVKYVGLCIRFKSCFFKKKPLAQAIIRQPVGSGSILGQYTWHLWCNEWQCDMFFFEQFGFPLFSAIPPMLYTL